MDPLDMGDYDEDANPFELDDDDDDDKSNKSDEDDEDKDDDDDDLDDAKSDKDSDPSPNFKSSQANSCKTFLNPPPAISSHQMHIIQNLDIIEYKSPSGKMKKSV